MARRPADRGHTYAARTVFQGALEISNLRLCAAAVRERKRVDAVARATPQRDRAIIVGERAAPVAQALARQSSLHKGVRILAVTRSPSGAALSRRRHQRDRLVEVFLGINK